MEENNAMDFLPTSLSNVLVHYEPITVLPPKKTTYQGVSFDAKIKNVPKAHLLERSFQPYLRASNYVGAVNQIYDKYRGKDFDMSVERQIKFLHDSPRNSEFKISRMPEKESSPKGKEFIKAKIGKMKRKKEIHLPPILNHYFQRFDVMLGGLSISSNKVKLKEID